MVFSYAESLRYHWPVRGPDLCTLLILISVLKKAKCSRSRRLEKSQSSLSDAFAIMKRMNSSEVKWSEVAQSCPTLCNPMDYSLPGSSVHGIFQARVLEWVAISFSRVSSWPKDQIQVSRIAGRRFNLWATREAKVYLNTSYLLPNSKELSQYTKAIVIEMRTPYWVSLVVT